MTMVQALATTSVDSEERFRARHILPGMAKRLREVVVSPASPVLVPLCGCDCCRGAQAPPVLHCTMTAAQT